MAHGSIARGTHSHLIAVTALIANGWEVAEPYAVEPYDIVARPPESNAEWKSIQIKTAYVRKDRADAIVIQGTKNDGTPYTTDEVDLMAGVMADGSVYIFECKGYREYWAQPSTVGKWTKLTTDFKTA